jgi:hypothetical protein
VLTAGEAAWTRDSGGTLYRFDGFRFSRRRRRTVEFCVVPSWMTPAHGWVLVADCSCAALVTSANESEAVLERRVASPHFAA